MDGGMWDGLLGKELGSWMVCGWHCFKGSPRQSVCSLEPGDGFDVGTREAACGHRAETLKCGRVPAGQGCSMAVLSSQCTYISSPLFPQECGCLDRDRIKSSITEQEFSQGKLSY